MTTTTTTTSTSEWQKNWCISKLMFEVFRRECYCEKATDTKKAYECTRCHLLAEAKTCFPEAYATAADMYTSYLGQGNK